MVVLYYLCYRHKTIHSSFVHHYRWDQDITVINCAAKVCKSSSELCISCIVLHRMSDNSQTKTVFHFQNRMLAFPSQYTSLDACPASLCTAELTICSCSVL